MLANAKVWCSKCEGYEHYNYQCPSECQHIRTVSNNDVDNSKVIEDVHVPIKIASIIKDITVDFGTEIFDEIHVSFDSIGDDVNEIVESNIPVVPKKSFEFPYAEISFMAIPTESYPNESSEFLSMIQQMVSSVSFFTDHLEFIPESILSLAEFEVSH